MICERCLSEGFLQSFVLQKGILGNCRNCRSRRVRCVQDEEIAAFVQNLLQGYRPVSDDPLAHGDSIERILQSDWEVFSDRISQDPARLRQTVLRLVEYGVDLADDHPDYEGDWAPTYDYLETTWHDACVALLTDGTPIDFGSHKPEIPNPLVVAFDDLMSVMPQGSTLFRARIHENRYAYEPFDESEILAPPREKVGAGRANLAHDPVLYVSDSESTCLAEVKPWRSAAVAIGRLVTSRPSRVVDLHTKQRIVNPYTDEYLGWKVQLSYLFDRLSYELSLPVSPCYGERDYRVTQELCRIIREAGYDGIVYQSSVSKGYNTVFFDTDIATVRNVRYVRVESIEYQSEDIKGGPVYDETPYGDLMNPQAP
jgi:hypothetical protein